VTYGTKPYVGLPNFDNLTDQQLEYKDVLVYTALKWFNNNFDSLCFPRHDTVGKLAGVSKNYVIASIKRLEVAGAITVKRDKQKHKSNYYYFPKTQYRSQGRLFNEKEDKIHKDFFNSTTDLTSSERAMLLCIRSFFNEFENECHVQDTVSYFAKRLGLTRDQVRKQFTALLEKGYVNKRYVMHKRSDMVRTFYKLTNKLDWDFSEYEWRSTPYFFFRYDKEHGPLMVA
jgi:DNA-binding MarR family transcriptional regulator